MTALSIQPTFPTFTGADGQPLENGYIWVGTANLNPITNPIAVYWDAALSAPATQPIRTLGGYPSNSGTPSRLYVNSDYSIQVLDRKGSMVYSAPVATERYGGGVINANIVVYDPAGTGAVATTVQTKLRETVSVKDFGAVGDGVTDDTAEILAAMTAVVAAGGGTLYFPEGAYVVTSNSLVHSTDGVSLTLQGTGPYSSYLICEAITGSETIFKTNAAANNTASFSVYDLGFIGYNGSVPRGTGLYLGGTIFIGKIQNVAFTGLNICIQGEQVFQVTFDSCRFRNYVTGITGTSGNAMQNNTFITCHFTDGQNVSPAVSKPINGAYMGYNTYIDCNFESSGLIASVDWSTGNGFDTIIGCRFERLNAGTSSWILPGNNQRFIGCSAHVSGYYNCANTAYYIWDLATSVGCVIDGVNISNSNYAANTVRLQSTARNNKIRFEPLLSTDPIDAVHNVLAELSSGENLIEWPGGSFSKYTYGFSYQTWGGGAVNNFFTDTFAMSPFTMSGLTNSAGPAGASAAAVGPNGYGNTRDFNTPSGSTKAYFSYNATSGYVYIFSIWVLPKTANDIVSLALNLTLATTTWRDTTLPDTTRWQRIFIAYKAPSTSVLYAQLKATAGCYVYGPQFEEWNASACRFGPSGFIPSPPATGGQNYSSNQNPQAFDKKNMIGLAAPTVGRFTQGDRVVNAAVIVGQPKSWVCTVSGSPGTWVSEGNL